MPEETTPLEAGDELAQAISAYITQMRVLGFEDEEIAAEIDEITNPMLRGLNS